MPAKASHMVLESALARPNCTTADVWALGSYMLLARRYLGFEVVDLRDPKRPVAKLITPPGYPVAPTGFGVGAIKSDGRYIYASDESAGAGAFVYDALPDPMNPKLVAVLGGPFGVRSAHNLWVDGQFVYAQNTVIDMSRLSFPRRIGTVTTSYTHDIIVLDGIAYVSAWNNGIEIWDVHNPRLPVLLGKHVYPGAVTHNMWPSRDRRYLYVTDENVTANGEGRGVRIFDISALPSIVEVGLYTAGPKGAVAHMVHVWGDLLFIAYRTEGLRVCSIRNPTAPVEIAWYDTYDPPLSPLTPGEGLCLGGPLTGCYGVYPWRPDALLVSDDHTGAYVLRLDAVDETLLVWPGASRDRLQFDFRWGNRTEVALDVFAFAALSAINGSPQLVPLMADVRWLGPGDGAQLQTSLPVPALPPGTKLSFLGCAGLMPGVISEWGTTTVRLQ